MSQRPAPPLSEPRRIERLPHGPRSATPESLTLPLAEYSPLISARRRPRQAVPERWWEYPAWPASPERSDPNLSGGARAAHVSAHRTPLGKPRQAVPGKVGRTRRGLLHLRWNEPNGPRSCRSLGGPPRAGQPVPPEPRRTAQALRAQRSAPNARIRRLARLGLGGGDPSRTANTTHGLPPHGHPFHVKQR